MRAVHTVLVVRPFFICGDKYLPCARMEFVKLAGVHDMDCARVCVCVSDKAGLSERYNPVPFF